MSEINVEGILERLEPYGDDCPFCHRDPYHYVDIGVGMERAAVNCCDLGNSLIQYQDEQLAEIVQLHRDAATIIRDLSASRDRASDACATVQRERDALREMLELLRGVDIVETCDEFGWELQFEFGDGHEANGRMWEISDAISSMLSRYEGEVK